ncbi:MAG: M56 family metallopeptidase, partial [Bacteroidota bacterium]
MNYWIHASIILAGLYGFYWLLLRKETFFKLNRWVLTGSLLVAIFLPLWKIPANWSLRSPSPTTSALDIITDQSSGIAILRAPSGATLSSNQSANTEEPSENVSPLEKDTLDQTKWTASKILWAVYLLGVAVFIGAFLLQFAVILGKRRKLEYIQDGPYRIYELTDETPPFSFGKWIFLNPTAYDYETYEQILAHEKLHVSQAHTLDKLLAEFIVILFWFNPFAWMMRTAITKNLEYLTDAEMLQIGTDPTQYQLSLVKVSVPQHALNLTTNYNESF